MDKLVMKLEGKDLEAWGEITIVEMPNQSVKDAKFNLKRDWYLKRLKLLNERVLYELSRFPKLTEEERCEVAVKLYNEGFKKLNKRISELNFTKLYRIVNGKKTK